MNEKEQESAIQDIETIKTFLDKGQMNLYETGFHFMLWGLLIPLSTLVYPLITAKFGYRSLIAILFWPAISAAGGIASYVYGSRFGKKHDKGFASRLNKLLWLGFLLTVVCMYGVVFFNKTIPEPILLSYIALLLGLAYWIHGSLLQLTWFQLVSLLWWCAAILISGKNWETASRIMGITTFLCSFIPGFILNRRSRRS